MSSFEVEYWNTTHSRVKAAIEPVFFIENYIAIAGYPLLLRPNVADFVNRLNQESETLEHNVGRGEGLTTGILAYVVWKAHNRPGTTHVITAPSMVETMEHLIHLAAMCRSVSWEARQGTVRKVGADIELENGSRIVGLSAIKPDALRGLEASTFVCDGFQRLSESNRANLALRLSTGVLGDSVQTILV